MTKLVRAFIIILALSRSEMANATVPPPFESDGYTLPSFPEAGSPADIDDLRILHFYQTSRTPDDCAKADRESHMNLNSLYGPATGVLTAEELEKVDAIAKKAITKGIWITLFFKQHFKRERPYHHDSGIVRCIAKPLDIFGTRSYPSSYAVVATILETILIREFPEKRDLIANQAAQIGINRVLGGVHHPSDVSAGVNLGHQIAQRLFTP